VKLVSFEDELNIAPGTSLNISNEIPVKGRTRVTADIHSINSDSIRLVCIFEGDF